MALMTACPACSTRFKVVPDQLRLHHGLVRCGACDHVFDANRHLETLIDAPTVHLSDDTVPSAFAPESGSTDLPAWANKPAVHALIDKSSSAKGLDMQWTRMIREEATDIGIPGGMRPNDEKTTLRSKLGFGNTQKKANASKVTAAVPPPVTPPVPPPFKKIPPPGSVKLTNQASNDEVGIVELIAPLPQLHTGSSDHEEIILGTDEADLEKQRRREARRAKRQLEKEQQGLTQRIQHLEQAKQKTRSSQRSRTASDAQDPFEESSPATAPQTHKRSSKRSSKQKTNTTIAWSQISRIALYGLSVLAALGVLAQVAVFNRYALAGSVPQAKPLLSRLCQAARCSVEPAQWLQPLTLDALVLRKIAPNEQSANPSAVQGLQAYQLQATVRNAAGLQVVKPSIELILSNAQGQLLARKTLPAKRLSEAPTIAPNSDWVIDTAILLDEQTLGYTGRLVHVD